MRTFRLCGALAALFLVAACTSLGLQQPRNLTERIAYAVGQHTAVLKSTQSALSFNEITTTDAEAVLKLAEDSRVFLDAAKVANEAGDIETAEGRLNLALAVLEQIETYLREAKAAKVSGGPHVYPPLEPAGVGDTEDDDPLPVGAAA